MARRISRDDGGLAWNFHAKKADSGERHGTTQHLPADDCSSLLSVRRVPRAWTGYGYALLVLPTRAVMVCTAICGL